MGITIHSTGNGWQGRYSVAFSEGFKKWGINTNFTHLDRVDDNNAHVLFANNSWKRSLEQCSVRGLPVLTVNRCFFGDRHDNVAIGWGGFNGDADFLNSNSPRDRWRKHRVPVMPWRLKTGDYALVLGEFRDMSKWYQQLLEPLKHLPVRFRPHPFRKPVAPNGWKLAPGKAQDDIGTALANAFMCVTYDTIGACDAVIQGVPTVAYGPKSMARPVSAPLAPMPIVTERPNRTQWLRDLAYAQWHISEIRSGDFWRHLSAGLVNP